jgi:hypothetical protein
MLALAKGCKSTSEEGSLLLDGSDFFCFFHFLEKLPKPNGPPSPNADKLMVAAFAAKGLN